MQKCRAIFAKIYFLTYDALYKYNSISEICTTASFAVIVSYIETEYLNARLTGCSLQV